MVTAKPPQLVDVLAAVWTVNRAAKRRRDAAQACYQGRAHGFANSHKETKEQYYRLKSQALHYLLAEGKLQVVGYHVFAGGNWAEVIKGENYTFHRPCPPKQGEAVQLDGIEANPRDKGGPKLKVALYTLTEYLADKQVVDCFKWPAPVRPVRSVGWELLGTKKTPGTSSSPPSRARPLCRAGYTRKGRMAAQAISINRAPVLTLWAAVVAQRLGFDEVEALTLGKAVAGLNAQAKGRRLGIFKPHEERATKAREKKRGEEFWIEICGRPVPAKNTDDGIRAVKGTQVIEPAGVGRYLEGKFGDDLTRVQSAMQRLAKSYKPQALAPDAYGLYERFRPAIPEGVKGWGAKGELDLGVIERLAKVKP
jgi:hypothetical protein